MSRSSGESFMIRPSSPTRAANGESASREEPTASIAGEISLCVCAAIAVNSSAFRFTHSWIA